MTEIDNDELGDFQPEETADSVTIEQLALKEKMFKLRKKIPPAMVDELDGMAVDELKARIVECEVNLHETEQAKAADGDLKALRDKLKEAAGPYNDAKKLQMALASYATCLLDEKGAV